MFGCMGTPVRVFLRPPMLNMRPNFRVLTDGASLLPTASQKTAENVLSYPPMDSESVNVRETPPEEKSPNDKSTRPFIFLWNRDQPVAGAGYLVRLPECDVVYKKEEMSKNKTARQRHRPVFRYACNPETEDQILNHYLHGSTDFQDSSSIFCVYNPGESCFPQKLLEAKARRVVVLEAPKSGYLPKWQKFAMSPEHSGKVSVFSYDFNRLGAGRVRDFHRTDGVDSLCQSFKSAGALMANVQEYESSWWGRTTNDDPPIRIMGVAEPFKEHSLFATLLYTRLARESIYTFGPVELVTAVSAQQYLDLHQISSNEKNMKKRRSPVPKLIRWRARLYRYLFDIKMLAKDSFDAFAPAVSAKNRLKYERDGISKNLYDELELETDKMYWVSIRPRRCEELETLVSQDYGEHSDGDTDHAMELERRRRFPHLAGFAYMHKVLSRHRQDITILEFMRNYFPEVDHDIVDEKMTVDKGSTGIMLYDLLDIYIRLASEGGRRFYNSPFFNEAQEFVEQIWCPTGHEPKRDVPADGEKSEMTGQQFMPIDLDHCNERIARLSQILT